jgi:outer membrane protein assembly factor BamB
MIRLLASVFLSVVLYAEAWTRFRGPNGSGISKDTGFPVEFGPGKNMAWRTPVRPGKSSPVLTSRHIFLTAFESGELFTQCFDRKTGKLLWERSQQQPRQEIAQTLNHAAAPSPVTDGENVYVFFKDYGLISYDAKGDVRWKAPLGPFTNAMGLAASPVVGDEVLVLLIDQMEGSFVAAFDLRNGEIRWKVGRNEPDSWGTPLLYQPKGSGPQIVTASRGQLAGHLVRNGKRVWSHQGLSPSIVASPVLDGNTVYVFGYGTDDQAPFSTAQKKFDKNMDGKITPDEYGGDAYYTGIAKYWGNRDMIITEAEWDEKQRSNVAPSSLQGFRLEQDAATSETRPRQLWRHDKNFTGVVPSPLVYQGVLYVLKNGGILTSFDPETGKVLKAARIPGAIGGYSASPIATEGRLYLASEDGKIAVLRAGGDWSVLAINDLGEACYATPALSGGEIYVRTSEALYRFASYGRE